MEFPKPSSPNSLSARKAGIVLTTLSVALYITSASTIYAAKENESLKKYSSSTINKARYYIKYLEESIKSQRKVSSTPVKKISPTPKPKVVTQKTVIITPTPQTYTAPSNSTSDYEKWVQESRDEYQESVDQMNSDYDARVSEMKADFEESKAESEQDFLDTKAENDAEIETWKTEHGF